MTKICGFPGCGLEHKARGYCSGHYRQHMRGAEITPIIRRDKTCAHEQCNDPHYGLGYCKFHYQRYRTGTDLHKAHKSELTKGACTIDGCNEKKFAKNLCLFHYGRQKRGYDVHAPRRASKGDGCTDKNGYRVLYKNGSYVFEHRWIVSQSIGRDLYPDETVHHINGVRDDNRIENLELWSKSHPYGQRVSDKIKWAIEILDRYKDRVTYDGAWRLK